MTRNRLCLLLAGWLLLPLVAPLVVPFAAPAAVGAEAPTPAAPTGASDPTDSPAAPDPTAGTTTDPSAAPSPGTDEPAPERDPLDVRIDTLSPAVVPRRGPLRVTGTVTNPGDTPWSEVQAYLAVSPTPITTPEELAAAQAEPAGLEGGGYQRLVEPGLYQDLPDLAPGASVRFRLVVPRESLGLPDTPGTYRVGVHALGTESGEGRIDGADGRARTFLTQMPARLPDDLEPTRLALVMQLRERVVRGSAGDLEFLAGWRRRLSDDGRLGRLLGLSGTTGGFPLTWVLDAAVVEAAGTVAAGNPTVELGGPAYDGIDDVTDEGADGEGTPDATDGATPDETEGTATDPTGSAGPEPSGPTGEPTTDAEGEARAGADAAVAWLDELRAQAPRHPVFTVPYADLDVAAAARAEDTALVDRAVRTALETLGAYSVDAQPLVAPLNGALRGWMVDRVSPTVPVLLSDDALPAERRVGSGAGAVEDVVFRRGERPVLTFDPRTTAPAADVAAAAGDRTDATALGMRQRLLAVTAMRTLVGNTRPLVALLPPKWDPGEQWQSSAFFDGLDVPWIGATGLGDVATVDAGTPEPADDDYAYRPVQRRAEVPTGQVRRVDRNLRSAALLDDVLVDDDTTGPRLTRQALGAASFFSRRHVRPERVRLFGTLTRVQEWLRSVRIAAPSFVVSSSELGSFLVPVVNELDQRVRVSLEAQVQGTGLEVTGPGEVTLAPGTRQAMKMAVRSTTIGVRSVDLDLVSPSGTRLYAGPSVSVRSSRVGLVVWVVMGVAAAVFFAAIVVRIVRRVRRRRRSLPPLGEGA